MFMKSNRWLEGLLIFCFIAVGVSLTDFASECTGETQELALFAFLPLSYIAIYGYISRFKLQQENKRLGQDKKKKHSQLVSLARKQRRLIEEKKEMHFQISDLKRQSKRWLGDDEE